MGSGCRLGSLSDRCELRTVTRDFLGYGGAWPAVTWPGGSPLAVSVVVNFEEGAEWQVGNGDPRSEAIGEVVSVVPPGGVTGGRSRSSAAACGLDSSASLMR